MDYLHLLMILWYLITAVPLLYFLIINTFTWIWFWVILVFYMAYKRFGDKFKYLTHPEVLDNEKYFAFTRNDYKNWSIVEFLLVGIFIVPIRIIIFFFYSVPGIAFMHIVLKLKKVDPNNIPEDLGTSLRILVKLWAKATLYSCGISTSEEKIIRFDEKKYPKLKKETDLSSGRIFISNHVSFLDLLYFFEIYDICTIARSNIKNLPIIGIGGTVADAIFVDRFDENSRKNAYEALQRRVDKNSKSSRKIDILIFPEGTTTNGSSIMQFKKGAFSTSAPISIHFLKYESNVCPSFNLITLYDMIIGTAFCLRTKLTVFKLDCCVQKKEGVTVDEYIEEVRKLYENEFGVRKMELGFRDKINFEEKYANINKNNYK